MNALLLGKVMKKESLTVVTIRIPQHLANCAKALSESQGRSISDMVSEALQQAYEQEARRAG